MDLEGNIDKLLAGTKPRKMTMRQARIIDAAFNWHDEDDMLRLSYDGYVVRDSTVRSGWTIAPEYRQAYDEALAKNRRSQQRRARSQSVRSSVMRSLGMVRTRSGSWE
jgi:hypothetical protein